MAGSDAVCLHDIVGALTADHRALEANWRHVRAKLEAIAAGAAATIESQDIEPMITLYERHIEREEKELLPMAARLLTDDALERIGRAMRERRGIAPIS
jgi:hemerythrin-like domain-containing protein